MTIHCHPSRLFASLVSAGALALSGCGRLHLGSDPDRAFVIFSNESMDQADVYAVIPGGGSRRIGTVMASRTDTLTVPGDITTHTGGLNIIARIFASNKVLQTGEVTLSPGETILVQMPATEMTLAVLPSRP